MYHSSGESASDLVRIPLLDCRLGLGNGAIAELLE
jgi:hypothetical protein